VKKEILINVDGVETRVAVLEDGRLVEISLERPETERVAGNIYKAKVENVLPGMQAAFVDIGLEKNAFLYVADAAPVINFDEVEGDEPPKIKKGLAINKLLKPGQKITVQVTKDPIGTKGARVSAYVTLPSHYVVLMPSVDYVGVSRRIADPKERQRLRTLAAKIKPRGMGVIVRTAAEGHDAQDIQADINYLANLWRKVQQRSKSGTAPRVLHQDMGLVGRIVRDVLTESVTRVVVDSQEEYDRVKEMLAEMAPALLDRVELHNRAQGDLFAASGVEAELDRALARRVWLKNGGYLVIDETEAFTVFDVNTGRYVGSTSLAQTVLDTNLEAATEIARQLRLRDIGGIIIVDFIDMEVQEHRQRVLNRLEEHLRRDRTRSHVLGLTELGLVEMTRKKVRQSLGDALTKLCPTCEGRGRVMSEETVAARVRREIRELLRTSEAQALLVEVHPAVAALLIGAGGLKLRELEREMAKAIYVRGAEEMSHEGFKFRLFDTKAEVQAAALPVQVGDVIDLRVEEQHVSNRRDGIARMDGFVLDIEGGGDRVGERVKVEVTKVHRTFARTRILGPERGAAPERRAHATPPPADEQAPSGKQEARQARLEASVAARQAAGATTAPQAAAAGVTIAPQAAAAGVTTAPQAAATGASDTQRAGLKQAAAVGRSGRATAAGPATVPPAASLATSAPPAGTVGAAGPAVQGATQGAAQAAVQGAGAVGESPPAASGDAAEAKPSKRSRSRRRRGKGGSKAAPATGAPGAATAAPAPALPELAAAAPTAPAAAASTNIQPPTPAPESPAASGAETPGAGEAETAAAGEPGPKRKSRRRRGPRRKKPAAAQAASEEATAGAGKEGLIAGGGGAAGPALAPVATPAVVAAAGAAMAAVDELAAAAATAVVAATSSGAGRPAPRTGTTQRRAATTPRVAAASTAPPAPDAASRLAPVAAAAITTPPVSLAPTTVAGGAYALSVPGAPLGPGRWPQVVSRVAAAGAGRQPQAPATSAPAAPAARVREAAAGPEVAAETTSPHAGSESHAPEPASVADAGAGGVPSGGGRAAPAAAASDEPIDHASASGPAGETATAAAAAAPDEGAAVAAEPTKAQPKPRRPRKPRATPADGAELARVDTPE
jgi:ribonuclease G